MSDSAIERLRERQRQKVPARRSALTQSDSNRINSSDESITNSQIEENSQWSNESNESNDNDIMTESSQTSNQSISNSVMTSTSQLVDRSDNNDSMTQGDRTQVDLKIEPIRRTIRLDQSIDEFMATLCRENKVTRETLIEAAISICSKNQKTLNKTISEAQNRYKHRKRIGELKKLHTMNQKFNRDIS